MASDSDDYMIDAESDFGDDDIFDSDEEENAPAKSKGKKGSSNSNSASVLAPSNNAPTSKKGKDKSVEERYQKKTQLEHILLRPDTYSKSQVCAFTSPLQQ